MMVSVSRTALMATLVEAFATCSVSKVSLEVIMPAELASKYAMGIDIRLRKASRRRFSTTRRAIQRTDMVDKNPASARTASRPNRIKGRKRSWL